MHASPEPAAIAPAPQPLPKLPVIAPASVPKLPDLPSPPGPLAATELGPEPSGKAPSSEWAHEPMRIQIGRTQMRVRPVRMQDVEHPGLPPFFGLVVINLTGGALDIQRGDAVLGGCAGGPLSSVSAVTQSLRVEQDCILRLRDGAIDKVLLDHAPRDD